jgi:holo-[acyl-carrier protein] synthase
MQRNRANGGAKSPCSTRIGCDLAAVEAITESINVFGDRYLRRVYSATELTQSGRSPERLAARFAGKEAVYKVLRTASGIGYTEIEIVNDAAGAPHVQLSAKAQRVADQQRLGPIEISLSHERGFALATAIALSDGSMVGTKDTPQQRGSEGV